MAAQDMKVPLETIPEELSPPPQKMSMAAMKRKRWDFINT